MSFENDVELINGYNEWVLERKRLATDLTPEAYLADRMKQEAADRVFKALAHIEGLGEWDKDIQSYEHLSGRNDLAQPWLRNIEEILRGDL